MRPAPLPRFTRRPAHLRALKAGCAITGLLAAAPGLAQVAPDALPQVPSQPLLVSTTGSTMTVTPVLPRTIINWQRYDIGSAATVEYVNPAGVPIAPVAVLNRVTGVPGRIVPTTIYESSILGTLRSADNISVYLVNPAGIMFAPGATVSVGSLIASTREITDNDFIGGTLRFAVPTPFGTAPVPVLSGSETVTAGATGAGSFRANAGIVGLIAARVVTTGAIGAAKEVAIVAANDTTLTLSDDDSPLTVRIEEGSALSNPLLLRGTINGSSVLVAAATRNDVRDGLLDIGADMTATSAYASDQGIVLAAGRTSSLAANVDIPEFTGSESPPTETAGVLAIALGGSLLSAVGSASDAAGGGIDIRALNGVSAPASGPAAGVTAATSVYGLADQESLSLGAIDAAALTLTASAGNIAAGLVTVGSGATAISATPGTVTRDIEPATFTGNITLAGVRAGGGVTVSGGSIAADTGVQSTAGSVALTATANATYGATGAITIASALADGATSDLGITAAALGGVGPGSRAALGAGRDVSASIGGSAMLAAVEAGRAAALTATTLDTTGITAGSALQATATTGALTLGDTTSGGLITLRAATALTATGTVRSSDGAVDARGGTVALNGADAATALDVVTTGSLDVGLARAGGTARLTSVGSTASVGHLTAGLDAFVTAGGRATVSGGGVIGRDLGVSGTEVRLGGAPGATQSVGRTARYTATTGAIIGTTPATGLVVRADTDATDAAAGAILLDAATGIDLRGVSLLTGSGAVNTGDVSVRLGTAGAPLVLDRLAARALVATDPTGPIDGAVTLGQTDLVNGLAIATPGSITAQSVAISGTGQLLTLASTGSTVAVTGALSAPGGVTVGGRGAVSVGPVTASAGPVTLASTTSTLRATGDVLGRGDVIVDAPGAVTLANVRSTAGTVLFRSTGAAPTVGISAGAVQASTDLAVTRAAGVSFASARSDTGAVALAAPGGLVSVTGAIDAATSATVTGAALVIGAVTAGTDVTLDAPGTIRVGDVRSLGGGVVFRSTPSSATGAITAGVVRATGDVRADRATDLSFGSAASDTGTVSLTSSGGAVRVDGATTAGTSVTVSGTGVTLNGVTAGTDATLTATTGALSVGSVSAGGLVGATAATDLSLASAASANDRVELVAGNGRIEVVGAIAARNFVTVDAGSAVRLGSVTDSGTGASLLRARGGLLTVTGPVSVGGELTVQGAAGVIATTVTSTVATVTIGSSGGAVSVAEAVSGRGTVEVSARDAIGLADVVSETGAVTIASLAGPVAATRIDAAGGASVSGEGALGLGTVAARGGDVSLASRGGAVTVQAVTASTSLAANAAGNLSIGTAQVGTGATLAGRDAAVGAISAGTLDVAAEGAAMLGTIATSGTTDIDAGGAVLLDGAIGAGGDLLARGASVALGSAGTPVTQVAGGRIDVTSTAGAITGSQGLILRSDSTGAGGRDLTLRSAAGIGFAGGTLLAGGSDRQSALRLAAGAGAPIVLDAVDARTIAAPGTAATLTHGGPVTIARVGTQDTLSVTLVGTGSPALTLGPVEVRAGDLSLDAAGDLAIGPASVTRGNTTLTGARVSSGAIATRGLTVTARSGAALLGPVDATAGGLAVTAAGDIRLPRGTATGSIALTSSNGDVAGAPGAAALASSGGTVMVRATSTDGTHGIVALDTVSGAGGIDLAGRTITAESLTASAGGVTAGAGQRMTLGAIDASGAVTLTTGDGAVALDRARSVGGSIAVTTVGGGFDARTTGGRPVLEAPAGAITLAIGGPLALGTATAGGAVALTSSGAARITGPVTAGGSYRVDAASIALGTTGATTRQLGTDVALNARTAAISVQGTTTIAATRGITATANGTAGAITLAPDTTLTTSGGDVALTTRGAAELGTVAAPAGAVRIEAADAALTRSISGQSVTLTNVAASGITRLGDAGVGNEAEFGAGGTRFDLTNGEVGLISAPAVTVASGARDVVVGALAVAPNTGSTRFAITASGRIDMLGRFVASGSTGARTIAIGNAGDGSQAPTGVIRVAATPSQGGRLLVDGAALALTAERIGVGYDRDFLDAIGYRSTGLGVDPVTRDYVARPTSTLYNAAALGAQPYSDLVLVRSGTLTLTYGRYALIQNTGRPGEVQGVVIGTPGGTGGGSGGQTATLRLRTPGSANNTFGFFGTIDGISSSAAALLGPDKLEVGAGVSPVASRINGCVIGSGAGCLNTSIAQPSLNLFDTSRAEIVRTADDLTLPFDPLIGTNNEALYLDPSAATTADDCGGDRPCPPKP